MPIILPQISQFNELYVTLQSTNRHLIVVIYDFSFIFCYPVLFFLVQMYVDLELQTAIKV